MTSRARAPPRSGQRTRSSSSRSPRAPAAVATTSPITRAHKAPASAGSSSSIATEGPSPRRSLRIAGSPAASVSMPASLNTYELATVKATKSKRLPPKSKWVRIILRATEARDGSFAIVAKTLARRILDVDPTVALKGLLVTHLVLSRGPAAEVFEYLASSRGPIELKALAERSGTPANVRRYAEYLDERLRMFERFGHDIIKAKSERAYDAAAARRMATMPIDAGVIDQTEALQGLLAKLTDVMIDFDELQEDDLTDLSMRYLFHDLFKLVEAVNEGALNQLQRFFTLRQPQAIRALGCYEKHRAQLAELKRFFDLAKAKGQDVSTGDLKLPPESLVQSLRDYCYGDGTSITLSKPPPPRKRRGSSTDDSPINPETMALRRAFAESIGKQQSMFGPKSTQSVDFSLGDGQSLSLAIASS